MTDDQDKTDQLSATKRAIHEIRKLRSKVRELESRPAEPIAIVGMACRFPGGANNPAQYWDLLSNSVDAIGEVPPDRWDADAYYDADPDAPGKMSTRWGGFLTNIDKFDPDFFGISAREAATLDPQHRLVLEVGWEALESAGQSPQELFGKRTGVFIGISSFDYAQMQLQAGGPESIDAYFATGTTHSIASGRLSYTLGLQGPSLSVDTACSSSLVAVHLACQSLRARECNLALSGGVNVILSPEILINFSKAHMMAADGRCKVFDAAADGFVRAEGCGMIALKRLSDAIADRDTVHAVIRGSAVNQDGRSSGLTAPNGPSQQSVINAALKNAGVAGEDIGYVEAHGTGTSLGDPIEINALAESVGAGRSPDNPLAVGSVKSNVGHLEAAAGVAGLIKTVLTLKHRVIPGSLHYNTPSPHIPWQDISITVPTRPTPWPAADHSRLAGVSAFGFGGTNAHVVIGEAPEPPVTEATDERSHHLLALSAKTPDALHLLAAAYVANLTEPDVPGIGDVCFTANAGRAHFECRLAVVSDSMDKMRSSLEQYVAGHAPAGLIASDTLPQTSPEVVFLFTGQGSQYSDMGRELFETQPVFRGCMEQCDELLRPHMDGSLLSVLYTDKKGSLDGTALTQPALFAIEYSLATLWQSWGVRPSAVIGHSIGEYVAACVAGVFSLEDGLKLVATRARLMQELPANGAMAVVSCDIARLEAAIASHADRISIGAINGPENIVVSGDRKIVDDVCGQLETDGFRTKRLNVSHAFHSPMIEPMLNAFEEAASEVEFRAPQITLISNLTGAAFEPGQAPDATYWRRHARETVRFADGLASLRADGYTLFVENGPEPVLSSLGMDGAAPGECWLSSLRRASPDWQQILETAGELYTRGVDIDWRGFDRSYARRTVVLPSYPFARERHWLDMDAGVSPQVAVDSSSLWNTLVVAGRRQSLQAPLHLRAETYADKWRCLDAIATGFITNALRAFGAFAVADEEQSVDTLLERHNISSTYHFLLLRWLRKLVRTGLLTNDNETFFAVDALPEADIEGLFLDAHDSLADVQPLVDYVRRCGYLLTEVLTEKESPLETLFPGGSTDTAKFLYEGWAVPMYFNSIARAAVENLVHALPARQPLRILEIGAGTGGMTASILPVLPPERTTYCYTDVSEFFFGPAEKKFVAYPFIEFGSLNIENSPAEQGYGTHTFDIVIASNVLHATHNLHDAINNALSLLKPDGILVLLEVTNPPAWFDISIGLIEGWQRFNDEVRSDGPLISESKWQELLLNHGFQDVVSIPEDGVVTDILGIHILLARAPSDAVVAQESRRVTQAIRETPNGVQGAIEPESESSGQAFRQQLEDAADHEVHDLLANYARERVMTVLRRDPDKPIDRRHRLMDLGIDSLMAVELRNLLQSDLSLEKRLPATLIFDYPNIDAIATYLQIEVLGLGASADAASDRVEPQDVIDKAELENLADEDVEAMIVKKLQDLER